MMRIINSNFFECRQLCIIWVAEIVASYVALSGHSFLINVSGGRCFMKIFKLRNYDYLCRRFVTIERIGIWKWTNQLLEITIRYTLLEIYIDMYILASTTVRISLFWYEYVEHTLLSLFFFKQCGSRCAEYLDVSHSKIPIFPLLTN